jgi:hypothetical protein
LAQVTWRLLLWAMQEAGFRQGRSLVQTLAD